MQEYTECISCGSAYRLAMDHIIPIAIAPHLAYEKSNLQILCRPCHLDKTATDISAIAAYKRELING